MAQNGSDAVEGVGEAASSYEVQHVHSVYEEIAAHFSSTRYKVCVSFSLFLFPYHLSLLFSHLAHILHLYSVIIVVWNYSDCTDTRFVVCIALANSRAVSQGTAGWGDWRRCRVWQWEVSGCK